MTELSAFLIENYGPDLRRKAIKVMPMLRNKSIVELCTRSNLQDRRLSGMFAYISSPVSHQFRNGFVYCFTYDSERVVMICLSPTSSGSARRLVNTRDGKTYKRVYKDKGHVYGFKLPEANGSFFHKLLSYETDLLNPLKIYRQCLEEDNVLLQKSPEMAYSDFFKAVSGLQTRMYDISKIRNLTILSHQLAPLV